MALERQITFSTGMNNTIDLEVEKYLRENEVDPAAIQVVVDAGRGIKTATLTYGDRESIKKAYEEQGRTYSNSDKVTYCHVKDIIVPFGQNLDNIVNNFFKDTSIGIISVSRYFTPVNQGAFILYIDLNEQKRKSDEKKEEVKKAQEELAQKLAKKAVKDADLKEDETVDKYSQAITDYGVTAEEAAKNATLNIEESQVPTPEEQTTSEEPKKKRFGRNR